MEEADVDALEKDLQDRPWVFGFKQVGIVEKYQVKFGNPRNLHSQKRSYPTPLYCVSLCNPEYIFEPIC